MTLPGAEAREFEWDDKTKGNWAVNATIGSSWRADDIDPNLIGINNGGNGGSSHDDGNLNFGKGETFTTVVKTIGEFGLAREHFGFFVRGKAWYDYELDQHGVSHGHVPNAYRSGARLNDSEFKPLTQFSGAALMDAYVFGQGQLAGHQASFKLGNHVVNWGEGVFITGINQFQSLDIAGSRRPGAQAVETRRPIPQISGALSLTETLSLEAFYQFQWRPTTLDGCGTYWASTDLTNCSDYDILTLGGTAANEYPDTDMYNDVTGRPLVPEGVSHYRMLGAGDPEARDSGQFGISTRWKVPALNASFGAYFVNYHQRSQLVGVANGPNEPDSYWNGANGERAIRTFWGWTAEDIKVYGLSAAVELDGWRLTGESSYTEDFPIQLNGVDLLRGAQGTGPLAELQTTLMGTGGRFKGYERKDKAQFQIGGKKTWRGVAGAQSLGVSGEVAYQHWTGIGDPYTSRRYGRGFLFGQGDSVTTPCTNPVEAYCSSDGYFSPDAWGYRLQVDMTFAEVMRGLSLKPRVYWAHDVDGYSGDGLFLQDRQTLTLALRADYRSRYFVEWSHTRYNHDATFDIYHDRSFYSVVAGINF